MKNQCLFKVNRKKAFSLLIITALLLSFFVVLIEIPTVQASAITTSTWETGEVTDDGIWLTGGAVAPSISSAFPYEGNSCLNLTTTGAQTSAYVYTSYTETSELYFREHFYPLSNPTSNTDQRIVLISSTAGAHYLILYYENAAGTIQFRLENAVKSTDIGTYTISLSQFWHNITLHYKAGVGDSDGVAEFWLDGVLRISNTTQDFDASATSRVRIYKGVDVATNPCFVDNVAIGTTSNDISENANPALRGDFSIVHIGDTHITDTTNFDAVLNWVLQNNATYNIKAVVHTGDIVEAGANETEIANANASLGILLDNQFPYIYALGLHDFYSYAGNPTKGVSSYIDDYKVFNMTYLSSKDYYLDSIYGNRNFAINFSEGNYSFIIVAVEYAANETALNWMYNLIETNPNSNFIVALHPYMNSTGGYVYPFSDGLDAWRLSIRDQLDTYPNVFLTLNGHNHGVYHKTEGPYNRTQSLFDYEPLDPPNVLQVHTFNLTSKIVAVTTYNAATLTWLSTDTYSFNYTATLTDGTLSDTYVTVASFVSPENITYPEPDVDFEVSTAGSNDTGITVIVTLRASNGTQIGSNQTTLTGSFTGLTNDTYTMYVTAIGDHGASDYETVIFTVAIPDVYYTLTVSRSDGGTVDPDVGAHVYLNYTDVTVTASNSAGYHFEAWEINGANTSTSSPIIVTMSGDLSIKAWFEADTLPDTYTLTLTPISPSNTTHTSSTILNTASLSGNGTNVHWWSNVWNFTSSSYLFPANLTSANTSVTLAVNGTYRADFWASDNEGTTDTDNVIFTVAIAEEPEPTPTPSPTSTPIHTFTTNDAEANLMGALVLWGIVPFAIGGFAIVIIVKKGAVDGESPDPKLIGAAVVVTLVITLIVEFSVVIINMIGNAI